MDKVSDLIEGARLSGRYTVDVGESYCSMGNQIRFIDRSGRRLCPLQVAKVERGEDPGSATSAAVDCGLPIVLATKVIKRADRYADDCITFLREQGY